MRCSISPDSMCLKLPCVRHTRLVVLVVVYYAVLALSTGKFVDPIHTLLVLRLLNFVSF